MLYVICYYMLYDSYFCVFNSKVGPCKGQKSPFSVPNLSQIGPTSAQHGCRERHCKILKNIEKAKVFEGFWGSRVANFDQKSRK